ncbi:Protein of unknown function, partial [Gryllus bimaculatus]
LRKATFATLVVRHLLRTARETDGVVARIHLSTVSCFSVTGECVLYSTMVLLLEMFWPWTRLPTDTKLF